MATPSVFVYGCYGYTGKLICEHATKIGLKIIVGGRNRQKCIEVAKRLALHDADSSITAQDVEQFVRAFDLSDQANVERQLSTLPDGCNVVMNAAGPYSETFDVMVNACLANELSYLDVTAEVDVFERAHTKYKPLARAKGVIVVPGCGFDVVPTDCMAAHLKQRFPEADTLELATGAKTVSGGSAAAAMSHGTAVTFVPQLSDVMKSRVNGKIVESGFTSMNVPICREMPDAMVGRITWGDISTAYHSTGIPNVSNWIQLDAALGWALTIGAFWPVRMFKKYFLPDSFIQSLVPAGGPSEAERSSMRMSIWGRATNSKTEKHVMSRITIVEAYNFTQLAAVEIMRRVAHMSEDEVNSNAGTHTPSTLFGADFVTEVDAGATFEDNFGYD